MGYPVIISDTAGIRDAKDEIEKKRDKISNKKSRRHADLKLLLLDPKNLDFKAFLRIKSSENVYL